MDTRFSVVIPSYNSWRTIGETLSSLKRQTRAELIEEVIVVDSSTDGATAEYLRARSDVRLIEAGKRVMPALGRNIGAAAAKAEYLFFIDSDAYAEPDAIERLAAHVAAGRRAGGGSVLLAHGQEKSPIAAAQYFLQFNEFMPSAKTGAVPFSPSCNLFCEKSLFRGIGGFPEIRASEDVLFGRRVNAADEYVFMPDVRVRHIFRLDPRAYLSNQSLLGAYVFLERRLSARGGPVFTNPALALMALPAILAVKCLRIAARVAAAGPPRFFSFLSVFPVFIVGLFVWAKGFAAAALGRGETASVRALS